MRFYALTAAMVAASCAVSSAFGQSRSDARSYRGKTVRVASYAHTGVVSYGAAGAPCDCGGGVGPMDDCDPGCAAPAVYCCRPGLIPLVLDGIGKTMHDVLVCLDECLLRSGHRCYDPCQTSCCGGPSLRYPLYDCDCDLCRAADGYSAPAGATWEMDTAPSQPSPAPAPREAPIEELDAPPTPPADAEAPGLQAPRVLEHSTGLRRASPSGRTTARSHAAGAAVERSVIVSRSRPSDQLGQRKTSTSVVRRASGAGSIEFRIPHNPLRD